MIDCSVQANQQQEPPEDVGKLDAPVAPMQRIMTIDILRGFALLGILLVNMEYFNQSALNLVVDLKPPASPLDQAARWFIAFFAEGKFYTTFSFLFGLGMIIQMGRAGERRARFGRFWFRRMVVLLGFGLVHAYLFWPGDILILYSVLGVALLLWRKARPRTTLIWAFIFLIVPLVINGVLWGLVKMGEMAMGSAEMERIFAQQVGDYAVQAAEADRIYATGSFLEITQQRARDMNFMYFTWPFIGFNVLAAMLLGLYAGKRGVFDNIPGHLPFIRKAWLWGLIIGVIGNALYVYFGEQANRAVPSLANLISLAGQSFGAPAMAIFYMASLTLLAERAVWRRRLAPLSLVGRMALTNYLAQSFICATLFYGYGFGLYGTVGVAGGVALTVVIYAAQVLWSGWWLRRFRFGPAEWLWRTFTYGKRQSMRLVGASVAD
jgi:uncharacterized protein